MSYKTQCGNAALFWLRFHAIIKKHSDYQRVIFQPVAASRRKSYNTFFTARGDQFHARAALFCLPGPAFYLPAIVNLHGDGILLYLSKS